MRPRSMTRIAAIALVASAAGCGAPDGESPGTSDSAIFFGEPSPEEEDAVVRVQTRIPGSTIQNCSGSLVAPNLLLTARHCIAATVEGMFTCTPDGELDNPGLGQPGTMGGLAAPEDIDVFTGPTQPWTIVAAKGSRIFSRPTPSICRNDIALVVLDRPIDAPILPMRLNTPTVPTENMLAIGYGGTDLGETGRFRRADIPVLAVGRSVYWTRASLAPAQTFGIGPGPCQGDSGGPAITTRGAVAGVFSLSAGQCGSDDVRNYYTQVAVFEALVREAFEAAEAEPLLEEPDPGGEAGASGTGAAAGDGSGATSGDAGNGGTSANGGVAGSSGQGQSEAGAAGDSDEPRGSRRGGGCTCTTAGAENRAPAGFEALPVLVGLALLRRARRRNAQPTS